MYIALKHSMCNGIRVNELPQVHQTASHSLLADIKYRSFCSDPMNSCLRIGFEIISQIIFLSYLFTTAVQEIRRKKLHLFKLTHTTNDKFLLSILLVPLEKGYYTVQPICISPFFQTLYTLFIFDRSDFLASTPPVTALDMCVNCIICA